MKINKELIKSQRVRRAWSQGQLAEASGLSLRTIQRIEKDGVASLESAKSLAAVFELEAARLRPAPKRRWPLERAVAGVFAAVVLVLNGLLLMPAAAKPITVDLTVSSADEQVDEVQFRGEAGQESEMMISNRLKVVLKAIDEGDDKVWIFTRLYELAGDNETLLASPVVMTGNKEAAVIRFSDYSLSLTPRL